MSVCLYIWNIYDIHTDICELFIQFRSFVQKRKTIDNRDPQSESNKPNTNSNTNTHTHWNSLTCIKSNFSPNEQRDTQTRSNEHLTPSPATRPLINAEWYCPADKNDKAKQLPSAIRHFSFIRCAGRWKWAKFPSSFSTLSYGSCTSITVHFSSNVLLYSNLYILIFVLLCLYSILNNILIT